MDVQEFQLENGLKILVKEDHRTAVVVSQLWYKVGGSYEPLGITGISHALEHMMFRGTLRYPNNQFSHLITAQGGRDNAQTSQDYTFYYEEFPTNQLSLAFELEADRMRCLTLSAKDFDKEKQVILEERRLRVDDDPFSLTYEQFVEKAFLNTYRNPVIGYLQDIKALNVSKLKKWYQTWYAPNNAILIVVGDVVSKEVYTLAKRFFSHLTASQIPSVSSQLIASSPLNQEVMVRLPAKLPWLLLGYQVPSLNTARPKWHAYTLEIIAGILSNGHSSRLNKTIVRGNRVATEADANYDLHNRMDGLFLITSIPKKDVAVEELKKNLLEQVRLLQNNQVPLEELDRVKNQIMARQVYKKDSMFGQARELGILETIGLSWKLAYTYNANIEAVTVDQIQIVAKRYLQPDRLTVGTLVPQS